MNKKSFLTKLRSKLSILEKQEIDDIIEEYSSHIDKKIEEGKTEKEAVEDFGNIDELVKEILSAYKINGSYKEEESKFEKWISNFIDSMVEFFQKLFDDVSEQKVSKILVTIVYIIIGIFLCGLLLWFVRIPFDLVKEIGDRIINVGGHNFLTETFETIWNLFVELACIVISIVIVAALIKKAIKHLDLNNDKVEVLEIKDDKKVTKQIKKDKKKDSVLMDFFIICLKIFVIVSIYIPLLMCDIGLAIGLGALVFFAIQGVISIGMIIMFIGMLMIAVALTILITKFLFSKGGVN